VRVFIRLISFLHTKDEKTITTKIQGRDDDNNTTSKKITGKRWLERTKHDSYQCTRLLPKLEGDIVHGADETMVIYGLVAPAPYRPCPFTSPADGAQSECELWRTGDRKLAPARHRQVRSQWKSNDVARSCSSLISRATGTWSSEDGPPFAGLSQIKPIFSTINK
jgi:hypothetical protein